MEPIVWSWLRDIEMGLSGRRWVWFFIMAEEDEGEVVRREEGIRSSILWRMEECLGSEWNGQGEGVRLYRSWGEG